MKNLKYLYGTTNTNEVDLATIKQYLLTRQLNTCLQLPIRTNKGTCPLVKIEKFIVASLIIAQKEASRDVKRKQDYYNLQTIISVTK